MEHIRNVILENIQPHPPIDPLRKIRKDKGVVEYLIVKYKNPEGFIDRIEKLLGKNFFRGVLKCCVVLPFVYLIIKLAVFTAENFSSLVDPSKKELIVFIVFSVAMVLLIATSMFLIGKKMFREAFKIFKDILDFIKNIFKGLGKKKRKH